MTEERLRLSHEFFVSFIIDVSQVIETGTHNVHNRRFIHNYHPLDTQMDLVSSV